MKKLLLSCILAVTTIGSYNVTAQLVTYPALPNNHLKSAKYTVGVKLGSNTAINSFVYQYLVNATVPPTASNKNVNDPCNISNPNNRKVLTNNHWTTLSYKNNGNALTIEITKIGVDITSCEVFPKMYNQSAVVSNGKATITINSHNKYMYLLINNDKMDPLFLFVDPLETSAPTANSTTVKYFGPGIHDIGLKYTPPAGITEIYIAGGAYVKGTIYTNNRSDLKIHGRGIISGEGYDFQNDLSYSAIYLNGSGTNQQIEGITSIKPTKYHLISRGTLNSTNVKCFSYNTTTDGWGGGINSTLSQSFFKVNDDVTKLYSDNMVIKNVICYHQTNTPIFEFGWTGQTAKNCLVDGLDIIEDLHVDALGDNGGIIGWAGADAGKTQTGHVFKNVRSDCKVNFLIEIHPSNTCTFTCENWDIQSTRIKSILNSGTSATLKCVKINDEFITNDEFTLNGGAVSFNNAACIPDVQAPTVPTNIVASSISKTSITLSWTSSTDNIGVTEYEVFDNGILLSSTSSTSFVISNLTCGTSHVLAVKAKDLAGNKSTASASKTVSTTNCTTTSTKIIEAESYSSMNGISTENTSDTGGGMNIGYINNGDWAEYKLDVTTGGTFTTKFRVASLQNGGKIEVYKGTTLLGTAEVKATGGWQTWTTITGPSLTLSTGLQTIKLKFVNTATSGNLLNINWFELSGNGVLKSSILSTEETVAKSNVVLIYPNPAKDNFTIDIANLESTALVEVRSVNGCLITSLQGVSNTTNIATSNWAKGIYFVTIKLNDVTTTQKLIIK